MQVYMQRYQTFIIRVKQELVFVRHLDCFVFVNIICITSHIGTNV